MLSITMLSPRVRAALQYCPSMATPPGIAMQIVELARQPEVNLLRVVNLLEQDPALAARVMRASNTAFFARHRPADNLRQAVVVIGLNATMNLALGFSLGKALDQGLTSAQGINLGWRRVLIASCATRLISTSVGRHDTEDLALGALLQDLGILALNAALPEEYAPILSQASDHTSLLQSERELLGTDHAEASSWLIRRWQLPSWLASLTERVHGCEPCSLADVDDVAVAIVAFAADLADYFMIADAPARAQAPLPDVARIPGFDATQLDQVLDQLIDRLPEVSQLFNIEIMSERLLIGIVDEARAALADRTLAQQKVTQDIPQSPAWPADRQGRAFWPEKNTDTSQALLDETLLLEFRASTDQGWPLSLAFLSLASYELLVDAHGPEEVSEIMQGVRRKLGSMLGSDERIFAYGSGELAVFLPKLSELLSLILLKRLCKEVRAEYTERRPQSQVVPDLRFGLATHMDQGRFFSQPIELFAAADDALRAQI